MKIIKESGAAVVLAMLLVGGAGCAAPDEEPSNPMPTEKPKQLEPLDMCSVFKPEELTEFGLKSPGNPVDVGDEEPGCDFRGRPFSVSLYKNQNQTVESYGKESRWASYKPVMVNGRPGAQATSDAAKRSRLCFTVFDAGGGVIVSSAMEFRDGGLDECAQSLKVAERIEPRMPR